jgi:hypothetical protein
MTQELLEIAGIGRDRLHLQWCSSAEAQRFAEIATAVTDSIKAQGKFDPAECKYELDAAEATLSGETLRWLVGKEFKITTKGDVYDRKWDRNSYDSILYATLEREYQINLIMEAIKDGSASPREIAPKIDMDLERISFLLTDMEKRSMVEFKGMEDRKPVFAAL